jgi:hypothetical protein
MQPRPEDGRIRAWNIKTHITQKVTARRVFSVTDWSKRNGRRAKHAQSPRRKFSATRPGSDSLCLYGAYP